MKRSRRSPKVTKQKKQTKREKSESTSDLAKDEQEHDTSTEKSSGQPSQEKIENRTSSAEHDVSIQSKSEDDFFGGSSSDICEDVGIKEKPVSTRDSKTMPDVFFQDEDGDTYLHIAVVQCNEGLVNFLIKAMKTKKLDIYNNLRQTPLHLAVITGHRNLIGQLVKAGCDVNAVDRHGQTPLHLACQRSDVESARAIFESITADREITLDPKNFDGFSPLHLAAMAGNRDLIGLVIDKGADINNKDACSGRTALHHAVEAGKNFVVEYFLSRGASANVTTYTGNTPLHAASGRHMDDMIRLLSDHGADVNIANMEGDTPRVVHTSEQSKRQLEASRKRTKKPKTSASSAGETSEWKSRKT